MWRRLGAAFFGLMMAGAALLLVGLPSWSLDSGKAPPSATHPKPSTPSTPAETTPPPTPCSASKAIAAELVRHGIKLSNVSIGHVNWASNPLDNTGGAFGGRLESRSELSRYLRGSETPSMAVRARVLKVIPTNERMRALSGLGYTPVQLKVPVTYTGNLIWEGGHAINPAGTVHAKAGDVIWVYTTRNCDVVWSASIRADCGNVGYTSLSAVKPD